MTKYYNNRTLAELNKDEYWQEITKDMRTSWSSMAFGRVTKLRKEYIIDFPSCPWQNLLRVYKFLKIVITKYGSPMIQKLIKDCLTELRKRIADKELVITYERNLTDENNRSKNEDGSNRRFRKRNHEYGKPPRRLLVKFRRMARNIYGLRLHRQFSAIKYTRKPYRIKRTQ